MGEIGRLPRVSRRKVALADILILKSDFGLLASRTVRDVCVVVNHEVCSDVVQQ